MLKMPNKKDTQRSQIAELLDSEDLCRELSGAEYASKLAALKQAILSKAASRDNTPAKGSPSTRVDSAGTPSAASHKCNKR